VLRDVGEPKFVRLVCGKHVTDPPVLVDHGAEVVVDGRSGPATLASLGFPERAEPAVARRDPPCRPIRHDFARLCGLIGQQPVPELGVVLVSIEQRVRAIRLHHLAGRDWSGQPPGSRAGGRA
jgi:hypothetical protein